MQRISNTEAYNRLVKSKCYVDTVSFQDKNKVKKARAGINPTTPASLIGQVAAELGLRAHADEVPPVDPPDPVPAPKTVAPRTFNKVLPNGSDARFCITGLPRGTQGLPYDDYTTYDDNGLDKSGGRTSDTQVPGLRRANEMDQYGPCDLYPPLTEWPKESYDR